MAQTCEPVQRGPVRLRPPADERGAKDDKPFEDSNKPKLLPGALVRITPRVPATMDAKALFGTVIQKLDVKLGPSAARAWVIDTVASVPPPT